MTSPLLPVVTAAASSYLGVKGGLPAPNHKSAKATRGGNFANGASARTLAPSTQSL